MAQDWRDQYSRYKGFFLNIVDLYKKRADLRSFLEVVLSLSTIVIFVTFALKPTVLTIVSLLQEIEEKENIVVILDQKINNLATATNVLAQNQSVIPDIDIAVSTLPKPDIIAKQIQGISGKNGVELLGISIGQVTLVGENLSANKLSDFKPIVDAGGEMPISISIRGDYSSIMSFVRDLENSRVASRIDVLGINASNTEIGQIIVGVVTARVPYSKQ